LAPAKELVALGEAAAAGRADATLEAPSCSITWRTIAAMSGAEALEGTLGEAVDIDGFISC
jgi:hypothetical protein